MDNKVLFYFLLHIVKMCFFTYIGLKKSMIYSSDRIDISYNDKYENICLQFNFKGKFTVEASEMAVEVWSSEIENNNLKDCILIWDCTLMEGFEISAKNVWRRCLNKHKAEIKKIIVISNSLLVRSTAKVMLKFFPFESQIESSTHDL